jgi:hypothetical protein
LASRGYRRFIYKEGAWISLSTPLPESACFID